MVPRGAMVPGRGIEGSMKIETQFGTFMRIPMKSRIMPLVVAALSVIASTVTMAAGLCNACTIKMVGSGPYYDSLCSTATCIYVKMNQAVSTRPSCATSSSWDFVLDISTASGRATYSLLLTAYASGQLLSVGGMATCSISPLGQV